MKKFMLMGLSICALSISGCDKVTALMSKTPNCSDPKTIAEVQSILKTQLSTMGADAYDYITENEYKPSKEFIPHIELKLDAIRMTGRNKKFDSYQCAATLVRTAVSQETVAEVLQNEINKSNENMFNMDKEQLDNIKSYYAEFLAKKISQIRSEAEYKESTSCEHDEYGNETYCYNTDNSEEIKPAQDVLSAITTFNTDFDYDACKGTLTQCLDLAYQDNIKHITEKSQADFQEDLAKLSSILSVDERLNKQITYSIEKAEGEKNFYVEVNLPSDEK